jgi:hypothetical protein
MMKKILFVLVLVFANLSFATMFIPLPFEKQVEEATSAAEVQLSSTRVFKNSSGAIMTEYVLDVVEAYNLSNEDLENNQLKIAMPGGTFEGVTSMVDGAPVFKSGEKTFLLLKKIESKIYLSNFTLGQYKIQNYEGKDYYVSQVFPMDQKVGRISKDKMVELMKTKWKTTFAPLNYDNHSVLVRIPPAPEREPKFEKRAPAQESAATEEIPVFFWGAIVMVAFFFALIFFKLGQSEHMHKRE